ncbi:MAG TPA: NAD(P)H-dependent glycerol-3-phosphate dehydrogenase [Acidobacteriota bacterium]|jgi:glycerol-3-phosphate dehydrogenase (NAD(P)+)
MAEIAILGAGSWGTALAILLARKGHAVRLWARRSEHAEEMNHSRLNARYLPGYELPAGLVVTSKMAEALADGKMVVCAVPSSYCRETLERASTHFKPDSCYVSATKGIEVGTLKRISEILREVLGQQAKIVVLSGPSFAVESLQGHPTAVVASSEDVSAAERVQNIFSSSRFRVYTNSDVVGTEIGGAVKNVIAIASGVVTGLGFGSNTIAGLITRGLAEICRLGASMGGRRETLGGLAGLGDLVLTCTGPLSRNRAAGIQLAQGFTIQQVQQATPMSIEGIPTTRATLELGRQYGVEMPITEQMYRVLYDGKAPQAAISDLMERRLREEFW